LRRQLISPVARGAQHNRIRVRGCAVFPLRLLRELTSVVILIIEFQAREARVQAHFYLSVNSDSDEFSLRRKRKSPTEVRRL